MVHSVPQKMHYEVLSWGWQGKNWMHEKWVVCEQKYWQRKKEKLLGKETELWETGDFLTSNSITYRNIRENECEATQTLWLEENL